MTVKSYAGPMRLKLKALKMPRKQTKGASLGIICSQHKNSPTIPHSLSKPTFNLANPYEEGFSVSY